MKIAICEDNKKELSILRIFLKEHYPDCIIEEFDNAGSLLYYMQSCSPDIVLLDIEMPGINGIQAAKTIRDMCPDIGIIFITAHTEFALEAFGVYALDYLVKPISRERLAASISMLKATGKKREKFIYIQSNGIMYKVKHEEIILIEKIYIRCYVHTENFIYNTIKPLNYFLNELNPNTFLRTHKAFVVNKNKIKSISPLGNQTYEIHFEGTEKTAPLSRKMKERINLI